jgi:hypothetical protein
MRHHSSIADSRPGVQVRPPTAGDTFFNGAFMRQRVPGAVPKSGGLQADASFFTEKRAGGQFVATIPVTVEALLERVRPRVRRLLAGADGAPAGDNRTEPL